MLVRKLFLAVIVLICSEAFPQGEAAISFLRLPTSPKLNGAGATGTASLTDDPYKFFFNPAHLGFQGKGMNFSTGFYPAKINWIPSFQLDLTLNSYVFTAGYDLEKEFPKLPLSIGVGYSRSEFNFGEFGGKDYYSSYSLGVGYRSFINISAGLTIKDINSILSDLPFDGNTTPLKAEATAVDYGILVNLPLNNFLKEPLKLNLSTDSYINTNIDYTLGYTIQNVGDKVYYVDPAQADPLPRTARLAHNIQIVFNFLSENYFAELINFSYSVDAEEILIKRTLDTINNTSQTEYQGLFGDIKPFKNLFLAKGDPEIVLHKGIIVEFFETVTYAQGGFDGRGFVTGKQTE